MVYLTNRKPDRAIAALRSTRITDLSGELRQQRLLLEARAQSDVGRHDLALDIISNITGREAIRLRSDIYWAARRWREASEQIELYYGDRWRDFKPLERGGEGRHHPRRGRLCAGRRRHRPGALPREICAADVRRGRPAGVRHRRASRPPPTAPNSPQIARMAASVDTLDGFLREMKPRFPDATARAPLPDPVTTGRCRRRAEAVKRDRFACRRSSASGRSARRGSASDPAFPRQRLAQWATCGGQNAFRRSGYHFAVRNASNRDSPGEDAATMSKPAKTEAELIAMAQGRVEGPRRLSRRHGHLHYPRRRLAGNSAPAPTRRRAQSPAIPNASRCWCRSAITSASSMM